MIRNVVIFMLITMSLFASFFLFKSSISIILLVIDVCFIILYLTMKVKALEVLQKNCDLEHKRRLELEQELLSEIDLSNRILRCKSSPLHPTGFQPSGQ